MARLPQRARVCEEGFHNDGKEGIEASRRATLFISLIIFPHQLCVAKGDTFQSTSSLGTGQEKGISLNLGFVYNGAFNLIDLH